MRVISAPPSSPVISWTILSPYFLGSSFESSQRRFSERKRACCTIALFGTSLNEYWLIRQLNYFLSYTVAAKFSRASIKRGEARAPFPRICPSIIPYPIANSRLVWHIRLTTDSLEAFARSDTRQYQIREILIIERLLASPASDRFS